MTTQQPSLKVRAQTEPFANLRLFNLQNMAQAAQKANDTQTLLEFEVEGLPLAAYLPQLCS
jgi:hypothetical protein